MVSVGNHIFVSSSFTFLIFILPYFLPWRVWLWFFNEIPTSHALQFYVPWTNANSLSTIYTGGNPSQLCTKYIIWCAFTFICIDKPLNQPYEIPSIWEYFPCIFMWYLFWGCTPKVYLNFLYIYHLLFTARIWLSSGCRINLVYIYFVA